jgi:chromosomal replication initiator protein
MTSNLHSAAIDGSTRARLLTGDRGGDRQELRGVGRSIARVQGRSRSKPEAPIAPRTLSRAARVGPAERSDLPGTPLPPRSTDWPAAQSTAPDPSVDLAALGGALGAAWRRRLELGGSGSFGRQGALRQSMAATAGLTVEAGEVWTEANGASGACGRALRAVVRRPTEFELHWLRTRCGGALTEVVRNVLGESAEIEYRLGPAMEVDDVTLGADSAPRADGGPIDSPSPTPQRGPGAAVSAEPSATAGPASGSAVERSDLLQPAFEEFVVGSSNEVAVRAAQSMVQREGGPRSLFIDGACGVGKTHLLRAICNRRRELRPGCEVLYTTGESFTNEFITALRSHQLDAFRARIRRLDLLAIDDVHFLADKNRTSSEFLHTIDHIGQHCKQVVLASDAPLERLQAFSNALRSRLMQGVLVHIELPDEKLRRKLVRRLAERRSLRLSSGAEEFLATRIEGTAREIEGALQRLSLEVRLVPLRDGQREVDGVTAALALRELAGERGAPLRPQFIVGAVCTLLRIDRSDLLGRSRHPQVVLGRMLVAATARRCTTLSFPEIGRLLGRAAHSTVHHAWTRAQALMASGERIPDALETGATTFSELLEQVKRIARRPT